MQVKPLHNYQLYGTTFLRYQFIGKSGNPITLEKIENLKVQVLYKGKYTDITNDVQKIFAKKEISVFMAINELFGKKRNIVARIVITWNYRNSTKIQKFVDNIKVLNDNFSQDLYLRKLKRENKSKRGKGGKRNSISKEEKTRIGIVRI